MGRDWRMGREGDGEEKGRGEGLLDAPCLVPYRVNLSLKPFLLIVKRSIIT